MALTAGLTLSCTTGRAGGIRDLYLISIADLTSMTLSSGSTSNFGTITLGSGKVWYKHEFEEDMAEFRETVEVTKGSPIVTQEVEVFLPALDATNRAAIQAVIDDSRCGMVAVIRDSNGTYWVLGYSTTFGKERPLRLISDNTTTNKALNETAGSTLVFQAISTTKACTTTASIVTS